MEWITAAFAAFVVIISVELADKTFVVTLVLATRFRALQVWLGVSAAFGVHCLVAVAAGRLLLLLPRRPVQLGAAALFAVGAVALFLGARRAGADKDEYEDAQTNKAPQTTDKEPQTRWWRAATTSFLVLFAAEWGDLSQLLTASLVASGRPAAGVFIGAWVALVAVAGAGVLVGRVIMRHIRLSVVRYIGAAVCVLLAAVTVVTAMA